jgi:hypothetical protein
MRQRKTNAQGGGVGERPIEFAIKEPLGGTGGAAGGGTIGGEGEPSGENTDHPQPNTKEAPELADISPMSALFASTASLAARTGSEEAAEAAALGPSPGSLADEGHIRTRQSGVPRAGRGTIGDALKSGEEPQIGAGTTPNRGELGGGVPAEEEGATGPAGGRNPVGGTRK